jgi:hypothetical protein
MGTYKTKRSWKKTFQKTTTAKTRSEIYKKIKETKKTKNGLTSVFLDSILKKIPHFLGVFPQDYLKTIKIKSFPSSFVVNYDLSNRPGIHWIAVYLTFKNIFVFDSLGFKKFKWPFVTKFLKKFRKTHRFYQTPQLQLPFTYTCGFYCIYFLISCQHLSFNRCVANFTGDFYRNDYIILDLLSK